VAVKDRPGYIDILCRVSRPEGDTWIAWRQSETSAEIPKGKRFAYQELSPDQAAAWLADRDLSSPLIVLEDLKRETDKRRNERAHLCSANSVYNFFGGKGNAPGKYLEKLKGECVEDYWKAGKGQKYWVVLTNPGEDEAFRRHLKQWRAKDKRGRTRKNSNKDEETQSK
jgi:hypothetical protein